MLTEDQLRAVKRYSSAEFSKINGALRKGLRLSRDIRATVDALDDAISNSTCDSEVIVYRGVGQRYAEALIASNPDVGDIIEDAGYLSTSAKRDVAGEFAKYEPPGMMMRIKLPKGCNALYLAPYSVYPAEEEWLLPRNAELRILGYDDDTRTLELELV